MQWNKYPRSVAEWIFIPLRRPQICPSYPSNICGASLPEAFRQWTNISGGYSNSSCSSARSLFSAVLSCNPCFFCRGCKTARSSFAPTCFRSGRCHDICLPEFIIPLLNRVKTNSGCYLLSGTRSIVEPRVMQYRFKRVLSDLSLPDVSFHSLRHGFATNCIAIGVDVKTLSEILGHSSVEITLNRYVHSSMERKAEYMKTLSAMFTVA